MKCKYCGGWDHLDTSCPAKKTDRQHELWLAWPFVIVLAPFWFLGMVAGFIKSAVKAGLEFGNDMWPETLAAIRGKKPDAE